MANLPSKLTERVIEWDEDGTPLIVQSLSPEAMAINEIIDYLTPYQTNNKENK